MYLRLTIIVESLHLIILTIIAFSKFMAFHSVYAKSLTMLKCIRNYSGRISDLNLVRNILQERKKYKVRSFWSKTCLHQLLIVYYILQIYQIPPYTVCYRKNIFHYDAVLWHPELDVTMVGRGTDNCKPTKMIIKKINVFDILRTIRW